MARVALSKTLVFKAVIKSIPLQSAGGQLYLAIL
jgi:hypothetical protein